MTKEDLIQFEEEVKQAFLDKKVLCPIHLSGGNEDQLIGIFNDVHPDDWVLSTHRSHYHALLHGIPREWLMADILAGRSMQIMNNMYHFFSSSIVAGIVPIAVGLGLGIKLHPDPLRERHVWCFVGDMAAETGIFHEAVKYSSNFELPVNFIIEDNGYSTDTPTKEAWRIQERGEGAIMWNSGYVQRYHYERTFPHVGCGEFVHF